MDENTETQASSPSGGNKSMMIILGVLVLAILGGGAYYYMNQKSAMAPATDMQQNMKPTDAMKMQATETPTTQAPSGQATSPSAAMPSGVMSAGKVVEVTVKGQPFSFTPSQIKVKKGDTVKVTFMNAEGTHDFVIDEFNARTKILKSGESETIQFVADKAGTFEFYCSVGNHRQMGMKGNLVVE